MELAIRAMFHQYEVSLLAHACADDMRKFSPVETDMLAMLQLLPAFECLGFKELNSADHVRMVVALVIWLARFFHEAPNF